MKIIYESAALFAFGVYGFYIENAKGKKLYIGQTSRYFKIR